MLFKSVVPAPTATQEPCPLFVTPCPCPVRKPPEVAFDQLLPSRLNMRLPFASSAYPDATQKIEELTNAAAPKFIPCPCPDVNPPLAALDQLLPSVLYNTVSTAEAAIPVATHVPP